MLEGPNIVVLKYSQLQTNSLKTHYFLCTLAVQLRSRVAASVVAIQKISPSYHPLPRRYLVQSYRILALIANGPRLGDDSLPSRGFVVILRHACDLDHDVHDFGDRPQHTLSHTCKSWRNIMLSNSSFWTSISIGSPGMYQTPTEKTLLAQKDMLDAWVSRSKSRPLSFTLRLDLRRDDRRRGGLELGEPAQNLVKSVIALSDRWISLDAECCFDLFHLLAPTVSAKIPMLEHVELVMRSLRTERGAKLPTITCLKCLAPS